MAKKKPQTEDAAEQAKLDRTHKDYEVPQDEKQAVETWLARIKRVETDPERKAWAEQLPKFREYVYGSKHDDASGSTLTRTNLVFATMAAMMPHLYAKNPDIGVTPMPGCPTDRLPMVKKVCTTAEQLLTQMLVKEGKLKRRAKSNVRSTMTTAYGVLKMVYQKDYHGDPITLRRIQDVQDNLARIETLTRDLKEGEDVQEMSRQREELREQLKGLTSGNEVKLFKGFVIDRIRSEDFMVLDDSIAEFDEYVDAAALGHVVWMTVGKFKDQFGFEPYGATRYNRPFSTKEGTQAEGQTNDEMFVCVIEIWDKDAQVVRTVAKGMMRWCREPYAPQNTPQRWYPFYVLGFNLVEGRWRPICDVELLMKLQDEYNTTRTNYADVREDSVPIRVFRKGGNLSPEDIQELSIKRKNRDWIGIEGNPTVPLESDIMQLAGLKIDPQAYDVSQIRNDMDVVVGLSDAGRANLIKPKTATEAEIMQQALGLRVEERRDANEDMISDMGEAALEIMLRDMTLDEVRQIAGDGAEWPEMSTQEIFAMVNVSVRAGSSGKPNAAKDREQWTQLLPVISEAMQKVGDLRQQGNYDMADAAVELLRETLRRFQERIDVDSLIPPIEKDEDGKPIAQAQQQAQMAQQLQQLDAQLQAMQGELQTCQQALQKAQAGEAASIAKIDADKALQEARIAADERVRIAEAKAKAEADARIAIDKAANAVQAQAIDADRAKADQEAEERRTMNAALLNAAVEVTKAHAEGQKAPEGEVDQSAVRMEEIVAGINQTMSALTQTMEAMRTESAKRTSMVEGLLTQDSAGARH